MGWTTVREYQLENKKADGIKKFLNDRIELHSDYEVVDYSKKGNTVYRAIKNPNGHIFALVTLISFGDGDFGWKEMDENMHPYFHDCPKKIIDKLSDTDNEHALAWRNECLKQAKLNKVKYNDGDILKFEGEIEFNSGYKNDTFILCKEGRSTYFSRYYKESPKQKRSEFRISNWKRRKFEVIGNIYK